MLSDRTGQIEKLEFARRAGGQVVTSVICIRSHPFNLGMIAPGNHLDLDSLRAAPPARYRSVVRKIGICRGKTGHRRTLSFKNQSAFLVWESPSTFSLLFVLPRRGAH